MFNQSPSQSPDHPLGKSLGQLPGHPLGKSTNALFSSYSITNTDMEYDAIRNKIKLRQQIMNEQIAATDRQSSLCDRIRSTRNSVKGLSTMIDELEYTNQGLYEYIRLLEYVRYGVWCTTCDAPKCINDQNNRNNVIALASTSTATATGASTSTDTTTGTAIGTDNSTDNGTVDSMDHTCVNVSDRAAEYTNYGNSLTNTAKNVFTNLLNGRYNDESENTVISKLGSPQLESLTQLAPLPSLLLKETRDVLSVQCDEMRLYLSTLTTAFAKDIHAATEKLAALTIKIEVYKLQESSVPSARADASGCTRATTRLGVCTRASIGVGANAGANAGVSAGASAGVSTGVSAGVSAGVSTGVSAGVSAGVSTGVSAYVSASVSTDPTIGDTTADPNGCTRLTTRLGVCTRPTADADPNGCTRLTTRLGVCTRPSIDITPKSQYLPIQIPIVFTGQSSQLKSSNLLQ